MKIHRYEFVGPDSLIKLNDLLSHGWSPVREICGAAADGSANTLVLLEKESVVLEFPVDKLIEGVPLEFLLNVMLFENFASEEIRQVVSLCRITTLARGAQIFSKVDQTESMYVVLAGDVQVARILAARLQETDQWIWNLLQQSQFARVRSSWRRFRHRVGGRSSSVPPELPDAGGGVSCRG